jgi:hypothetical protein
MSLVTPIGCSDGSFCNGGRPFDLVGSERSKANWDTNRFEKVDRFTIDGGILLPSQQSYICFPLSKFGIDRAISVKRIDSSCSCVEPSFVRYLDERGEWNDALLLKFTEESKTNASKEHSSATTRLSVALTMTLAGSQKVIAVDVLCVGAYEQISPENDAP